MHRLKQILGMLLFTKTASVTDVLIFSTLTIMCHYHQADPAPYPHHRPGGKADSDSCQILHRWRGEWLCRHCQVPEHLIFGYLFFSFFLLSFPFFFFLFFWESGSADIARCQIIRSLDILANGARNSDILGNGRRKKCITKTSDL